MGLIAIYCKDAINRVSTPRKKQNDMNKFQNKYRIPSARLQNWDYGSNGAYFVTICTQHRECYFGDIVVRDAINRVCTTGINHVCTMELSEIGKLAEQYWMEIPNHFPFVELGNFVVMPNHVHGILIINKMGDNVETRLIASLQSESSETNGGITGDNNPMLNQNISRIIRWYKGRCSFEMRKIHADFGWQSRFHDHIIRNAQSFENIQNYIADNPMKWNADKFYKPQ